MPTLAFVMSLKISKMVPRYAFGANMGKIYGLIVSYRILYKILFLFVDARMEKLELELTDAKMELETVILKAFHERAMFERRLKSCLQKIEDTVNDNMTW